MLHYKTCLGSAVRLRHGHAPFETILMKTVITLNAMTYGFPDMP